MSSSINGWPVPPTSLRTFAVPGTTRRITCDRDAGRILVAIAADYHRLIRAIDKGRIDDGGYAARDARNAPGQLSNHASGTAIDLNWSEEGAQGSNWGRKLFHAAARGASAIRARAGIAILKRRYGKLVQWGGDWRAQDWMHWEIRKGVTRAQIRAFCDAAGIDEQGRRRK